MFKQKEITVAVDLSGRIIMGRVADIANQGENIYRLENPYIVQVVPEIEVQPTTGAPVIDPQTGQPKKTGRNHMSLHPYVFHELLSTDCVSEVSWDFPKEALTISKDHKLPDSVKQQYTDLIQNFKDRAEEVNNKESKKVDLFDDNGEDTENSAS